MIRFLEKSTLLVFHEDHLRLYGGKKGIRDHGLLDSALAQAQASFDGDTVHPNLFHMAAAYGYHLCQNHPFIDGNKRTALVAMYLFLHVNGYQIKADNKSLFAIMIGVASGVVGKQELADYLAEHARRRP
jgi:death on curing protein